MLYPLSYGARSLILLALPVKSSVLVIKAMTIR